MGKLFIEVKLEELPEDIQQGVREYINRNISYEIKSNDKVLIVGVASPLIDKEK